MDGDTFQKLSQRTLSFELGQPVPELQQLLAWDALGLTGEAGEVADIIKKSVYHGKELNYEHLIEEIGDVLWYAAALCSHMGISLSEVMERNIKKLEHRYPDGFRRSNQTGTPHDREPSSRS